jgi:CDP-glycerol glycerophosphotransferase (TagB/SpsB family)
MKVLLLVNGAPEVLRWIKRIYDEVSSEHEVIIVSDSQYTNDFLEAEDLKADYCFSDFFRKHYNEAPDEKTFSEKFGNINIWASYYPDFERSELHYGHKYPEDYHKKLLTCLYLFFDEIIYSNNVRAIIYENVSNSFAYAAYNVGKLHQAEYFGIVKSRLPMRFELFEGRNINSDNYINEYRDFLDGRIDEAAHVEADMYVTNFNQVVHTTDPINNPSLSFARRYFNRSRMMNLRVKLRSLKWLWRSESKYAYQSKTPLLLSLRNFIIFIKRKFRLDSVTKYYSPVKDEKFFLYPLHLHPESTTSVQAPHYINEVEVIQNLAINLPFGYWLYVKDHPSNAGNNNSDFYRRIDKIPNVKIISFREDSKRLIPRSTGVITLTSTVGFEALILNKPVIAFGDVFYEKHPLCFKASGYNDVWQFSNRIIHGELPLSSPVATAYAFFRITYKYSENEVGEFVKNLLSKLHSKDKLVSTTRIAINNS